MDRNKIKLSALLLVTILPIALATWVFNVLEMEGAGMTTNNGVLIRPVLDITELGMVDAEGEVIFETFEQVVADLDVSEYRARPWTLIYLGMENCDTACGDRLFFLRQLHRRLGADALRVERYYLNANAEFAELDEVTQAMFTESFSDLKVAFAQPDILRANLARVVPVDVDPINMNYIFLADPLGNVMMYFTPDNTPEEIFRDINKLLEQSGLG